MKAGLSSIVALTVLLAAQSVFARPASLRVACYDDDLASATLERATVLGEVYAAYLRYKDCAAGGGFAEELSDRVMRELAGNWQASVYALAPNKDYPELTAFVLQHIDETGDEDHLRQIYNNSTKDCLYHQARLCGLIAQRSRHVIASLKRPSPKPNRLTQWCAVNSPSPSWPHDMAELPRRRLHIVRPSRQHRAKEALSGTAVRSLTRTEAADLLRSGEALGSAPFFYLVRAAALGIGGDYGVSEAAYGAPDLRAWYSTLSRKLEITNGSLSGPGAVPTNFGLLVETPGPVTGLEVNCVTAE